MVYERWRNIKFKYRNRAFGGKPVLSTEKNARKIVGNRRNQLKEDGSSEHLTLDLPAPFTGGKQQNAPAGALYAVQA